MPADAVSLKRSIGRYRDVDPHFAQNILGERTALLHKGVDKYRESHQRKIKKFVQQYPGYTLPTGDNPKFFREAFIDYVHKIANTSVNSYTGGAASRTANPESATVSLADLLALAPAMTVPAPEDPEVRQLLLELEIAAGIDSHDSEVAEGEEEEEDQDDEEDYEEDLDSFGNAPLSQKIRERFATTPVGVRLYQLALQEERFSVEYLNSVVQHSTQDMPQPLAVRPVVVVAGPSASGKSYAAAEVFKLTASAFPKATDSTLSVRQYVASDGGIARDTSQMRKLLIQLANAKGYTGIKDLHRSSVVLSNVKGCVREAVWNTSHLGLVIPDTFARVGIVANLSNLPGVRQVSAAASAVARSVRGTLPDFVTNSDPVAFLRSRAPRLSGTQKFLEQRVLTEVGTRLVFCQVQGVDAERFRSAVAFMGARRAWKVDGFNERASFDLNQESLAESKRYDGTCFSSGVAGSLAVEQDIRELNKEEFLGLTLYNDLRLFKPDLRVPGAWVAAQASDAEAILVPQPVYTAWLDRTGADRQKTLPVFLQTLKNDPVFRARIDGTVKMGMKVVFSPKFESLLKEELSKHSAAFCTQVQFFADSIIEREALQQRCTLFVDALQQIAVLDTSLSGVCGALVTECNQFQSNLAKIEQVDLDAFSSKIKQFSELMARNGSAQQLRLFEQSLAGAFSDKQVEVDEDDLQERQDEMARDALSSEAVAPSLAELDNEVLIQRSRGALLNLKTLINQASHELTRRKFPDPLKSVNHLHSARGISRGSLLAMHYGDAHQTYTRWAVSRGIFNNLLERKNALLAERSALAAEKSDLRARQESWRVRKEDAFAGEAQLDFQRILLGLEEEDILVKEEELIKKESSVKENLVSFVQQAEAYNEAARGLLADIEAEPLPACPQRQMRADLDKLRASTGEAAQSPRDPNEPDSPRRERFDL